ncbi:mechanosensitive ion channel family protein [Pseudomonas sp. RC10]|uniref:mechanosensitive ion channel family protein n=1 Tax=Pseudomonas bambusae TaxID=3139142 RepID=UPI00313A4C23
MPSDAPHYSLAWSLLLLLADVAAWHLLADRNRLTRIGIRLMGFVAYSLVIASAGVSPLEAPAWPDNSAMQFAATALAIVWWMYAARTLTVLLGLLLTGRVGHSGRLLQEVIGAVVFLIAIVAAAGYVLQLPVKGLLATSGAMAIIVGLALQSTLSDVFSGIILNTTKPYQVDDAISIDGMEGKVMDIDWRATHLMTGVGTMVVIPNSVAAKAKIVNLSRPVNIHGVSITVMMSPHIRPRRVLDALERALQGCSALLQTPQPRAVVKDTSPTTIEYSMTGFISDLNNKSDVRNLLFDLAYRHLEAAGIAWQSEITAEAMSRPRALLDEVKVFRASTAEEKDELAQTMVAREFATGQTIMDMGDEPDGLWVIATGVVSVRIPDGREMIEAGRMGPGEVMGVQNVLDDSPSEARFIALTSCVMYRIEKAATRKAMEQRAEITTALNKLQAVRQQNSQHVLLRKPVVIKKNHFLGWLQKR